MFEIITAHRKFSQRRVLVQQGPSKVLEEYEKMDKGGERWMSHRLCLSDESEVLREQLGKITDERLSRGKVFLWTVS